VAAKFGVDPGTGGHALTEPQEMHAEVAIVEYEATPKILPVVEKPFPASLEAERAHFLFRSTQDGRDFLGRI
jgi:hypothetical protein